MHLGWGFGLGLDKKVDVDLCVIKEMRHRVCTLISESFRIQDYASKFLGKGALTPKSFANIVLLIEEFLAAKKQL